MFRLDDPRSEPRILHELTLKKWRKTRRAILLFVLSTKTTKERFLLKRCQRNGNLYRNTIKDGDSQTCPLPIFPEGVGTSVQRLSPRLPPFFSASIREGLVALSVGHPRGTHLRYVIGCCLIPLGICGLKNNSRRITYWIGCVWRMPSLSPLFSVGMWIRCMNNCWAHKSMPFSTLFLITAYLHIGKWIVKQHCWEMENGCWLQTVNLSVVKDYSWDYGFSGGSSGSALPYKTLYKVILR